MCLNNAYDFKLLAQLPNFTHFPITGSLNMVLTAPGIPEAATNVCHKRINELMGRDPPWVILGTPLDVLVLKELFLNGGHVNSVFCGILGIP